MRKITQSTLVSLDGVVGTPYPWAGDYFDDEAQQDALQQLLTSGAILMGRRTYEALATLWPAQTGDYADRTSNTSSSGGAMSQPVVTKESKALLSS